MTKLKIHDLDTFAATYPHLVKTIIRPDSRKILRALRDGWEINGIDIVDGDDEKDKTCIEETYEEATDRLIKSTEEKHETPNFMKKQVKHG